MSNSAEKQCFAKVTLWEGDFTGRMFKEKAIVQISDVAKR